MIRTVRQLVGTARNLVNGKEIVVKDSETGKVMIIENVSKMKTDTDPNDIRYVLNCKKAGDGCMVFNTFDDK